MRGLGVCVLCISCLFAGGVPALAEEAPPPIEWLFIQEAETALFTNGELVLTGVAPDVLAFSDRPNRIATRIGLDKFIGFWTAGQDGFDDDLPNAGVTMITPEGTRTAVIEMEMPHAADQTLVYPVKALMGQLPEEGADVFVFIDAFPTAVNTQITDSVSDSNAVAMAAANAVYAQQQANAADQATVTIDPGDPLDTSAD